MDLRLMIGIGVLGVVGLATGFTYWEMAKVLKTHIGAADNRPEDYGLAAQNISTGEVGRRISGWYFAKPSPKGGVVLVHGLGLPKGGKAQMLAHAKNLFDAGWSTVVLDLYSFGESDGSDITLGSSEWQDVVAGYKFLKLQPELKGKPIGLMGISMGGASVIIAAGKEQIGDFVITWSAYPTIMHLLDRQLVLRRFPEKLFYWPTYVSAKLMIRPYRDAFDYVGKIKTPMLMIHGKNDERVLLEKAVEFKKAAGNNLKWVEMDTGHDVHAEKPNEFDQLVLDFLLKMEIGD